MSKTNTLRELIQSKLSTVVPHCWFETADDDSMFPHIVWNLKRVNTGDLNRDDIYLDVDIWDKSENADNIEDYADSVEALLKTKNLPQTTILPTFFLDGRQSVEDSDKMIKHRLVTFIIQNYEV